jgi:transposase-like protein
MICPHCTSENVEPIGKSDKLAKMVYFCINCARVFSVITQKV